MITSFFKPKRSPNDDDAPSNADENNNENNKQKLHTGNNTGGDNNNKHELSTTTTNNTKRHKTSNRTLSSETMQLISYLNKVEEKVDEKDRRDDTVEFVCWSNALERHFSTPSFARLASFVESQRRWDTRNIVIQCRGNKSWSFGFVAYLIYMCFVFWSAFYDLKHILLSFIHSYYISNQVTPNRRFFHQSKTPSQHSIGHHWIRWRSLLLVRTRTMVHIRRTGYAFQSIKVWGSPPPYGTYTRNWWRIQIYRTSLECPRMGI